MKSRLDKLLSANGFGSRRDIKRLLKSCCLTVNGNICTDPGFNVDSETDLMELDGEQLHISTMVYLMLNKPAGVVTSTEDPAHRTVIDLLDEPYSRMGLFPIGRLDRDTEGLLILTNDGPLTHRLTSPKTGFDKTYFARLRDLVNEEMFSDYAKRLTAGVTFHDGYTCLPATLLPAVTAVDGNNGLRLTIHEGKYHQVKKMFKALGNEVTYLQRVAMGPLTLDRNLRPGDYRELRPEEIAMLTEQ